MDNIKYETKHIGVLDGMRALAIIIVVWYHFWQQSWLMPNIGSISLDWLPRYGFLFVDMLLLISSFCLFLPYARHMVFGEKMPLTKEFYQKRVIRIIPSYYLALFLILFLFAIPNGEYSSVFDMLKDIFRHLFFVHNWFYDSVMRTPMLGVLWTLGVEVQYYLLFPFLAKAFTKKPWITYLSMLLVGIGSSYWMSSHLDASNQWLFVNNTFSFASVYANGMLGAYLYMKKAKSGERKKWEGFFFTVLAMICIYIYKLLCGSIGYYEVMQKWQIDFRLLLSFVFLLFVLSCNFSTVLFRKIWDNFFARFIAKISLNLYIWHQWIAVKLKEWRIPFWEGDTPPNFLDNKAWQIKYTIICVIVSALVACFMTYCVEIPCAKALKKFLDKRS